MRHISESEAMHEFVGDRVQHVVDVAQHDALVGLAERRVLLLLEAIDALSYSYV